MLQTSPKLFQSKQSMMTIKTWYLELNWPQEGSSISNTTWVFWNPYLAFKYICLWVICIDKAPFAGKNVWKLIIPFPHLVWIWSIDQQQAISKPLYYYKVHRQRRIFLPILRWYAIDNFSSSKIAQWKLYSFSFEGLYYLYLALDVSFKEKKVYQ